MSPSQQSAKVSLANVAAILPNFDELSPRTRDAIGQLGLALIQDFYEQLREARAPTVPNFLHDPWTQEDDAVLRDHYKVLGLSELAEKLGRSPKAVILRLTKLRLRRSGRHDWSERDVKLLKRKFGRVPLREIAASLKRSVSSVDNKARKLGLFVYDPERPQSREAWTNEELEYLREHQEDDAADVAAALGRSTNSIYSMSAVKGIPRKGREKIKTGRDSRIVELKSKGLKNSQIKERLGVSDAMISAAKSRMASRMGKGMGGSTA